MRRSTLIWTAAALIVVILAAIVIATSTRHRPDDGRTPEPPVSSVTSAPIATGAPTPTAAPPGEPMDGDDGGEAAAGCIGQAPGTACDDLLPPETINPKQVAATDRARAFVEAYTAFATDRGVAAWRKDLAPYVAPNADIPVTALARTSSALADLHAVVKLDMTQPVQAYPDGVDSAGNWRFTINATATARYVDATGTASNWAVPATWTVTMNSASQKVVGVEEDTPLLDNAP